MNKAGQPLVDNFNAPELIDYVDDFRKGARTLWGHTLMARTKDFGWQSERARQTFGDSREKRFSFYHQVGSRYQPGSQTMEYLKTLEPIPERILGS
jgi:hypothetical protein